MPTKLAVSSRIAVITGITVIAMAPRLSVKRMSSNPPTAPIAE